MVAYNPRLPDDERPTMPSEIAAQLQSALVAHWNKSEGHGPMLEGALAAAAQCMRAFFAVDRRSEP